MEVAAALLSLFGALVTGRDALRGELHVLRARVWIGALSICFMVGAGFWVWAASL